MRQQKTEGWDLLKVQEGLSPPAYDAMAKTAKEVGIRFGGHVPDEVGLLRALDAGQETFDHIDGYIEQLDGRAKAVDDKGVQDLVAAHEEGRRVDRADDGGVGDPAGTGQPRVEDRMGGAEVHARGAGRAVDQRAGLAAQESSVQRRARRSCTSTTG